MSQTHITKLRGRFAVGIVNPTNPKIGDEYFDLAQNGLFRWSGNNWLGTLFSSTSTSTTTSTSTSTSTSTTST
jgi:hypothetical protein